MLSWKSVASLALVGAASLALLLPLALSTPPRDGEVWLFQSLAEMQDQQRHLPLLNGEVLQGTNPLPLAALALVPVSDITAPRLVSAALGVLLAAFVFLYALALFDLTSALTASVITLTSLGYLALFGTLNLTALPVALAASAFGLFSLAYLGMVPGAWYIVSYALAAGAAVTGGYLLLVFFTAAALLLVLLDLAPSRLFAVHLAPGAAIIVCALAVYFAAYRLLAGPGITTGALTSGDHLGFFRGLLAAFTYGAPWIFPFIPAFLAGGGPSDREGWRRLLPLRIACGTVLLMLWFSSSILPQHAVLLVPFAAPLTGAWLAHGTGTGKVARFLGPWMMALSGAAVFAAALVVLALPMVRGAGFRPSQLVAAAAFAFGAAVFAVLVARRRHAAQFVFTAAVAALVVWWVAFVSPKDQWDEKISYMQGISAHDPLVVYQDDVTMRGYLSAVTASPVVVDRNAVPMGGTAFLAVSTPDLEALLTELGGRMQPVVLDSYRAERTYALMMVSPRLRAQ